jgi:APA family basic amino acid/polyamine antiporter
MNHTGDDLARQLRLFPATNIVIADMIGAGIFTTSGLLLLELGSPLLMIGLWVGGGIMALSGALCYGALGAAMPRAGGEYAYLSELFHPLLGFLSGWVSFFVGFSAPLAASSLGFSEYLASALPLLGASDNVDLLKKAIALTVIVALALVHLRGLALGSRIQNYLTVGKVLLIVALIAAGFVAGQGEVDNFSERVAADTPDASWKVIGLSLMWIMFAYSGWNASGYIGSEIKNPRRNLPLSLVIGTGTVLVLYVGLNALFVYAVAPSEMQGVIAVGGLAAPRVYYAMAKDGYFFKSVVRVHPVHRVPSTAIMLQCLIAGVMVLSGTFDQILTYMGFGLGIFPILAVLGVFKLRRTHDAGFRPGFYVLPAVVFASVSLAILALAYFERPVESTIAVVTVVLGIPVYLRFARSKRREVMR